MSKEIMSVSDETLRVATAIYAALNGGRIPNPKFFTTPATGGEDYVKAAVAAGVTIESIRSEVVLTGAKKIVEEAAPKVEPATPVTSSRRTDWHYDSQGYCDNPARGY